MKKIEHKQNFVEKLGHSIIKTTTKAAGVTGDVLNVIGHSVSDKAEKLGDAGKKLSENAEKTIKNDKKFGYEFHYDRGAGKIKTTKIELVNPKSVKKAKKKLTKIKIK